MPHSSDPPESAARPELTPLRILLVASCCAIPALVKLLCYPEYPGSDDAFIHAAVIQNVHRGMGWGIQPGEPVFLSTSPLFTVASLGLYGLTDRVMPAGMALSLVASCLYVLGVFAVARRRSRHFLLSWSCAFLAATNVHLWRWSGTFLEVTFATCSVVWLTAFFLDMESRPDRRRDPRPVALGFLIGLGALLRPEVGLVAAAFFLHDLVQGRPGLVRRHLLVAGGLALALVPVGALVHAHFGVLLPTTFTAKTTAGLVWWNPTVWIPLLKTVASGCPGVLVLILACLPALRTMGSRGLARSVADGAVFWCIPLAGFLFYSLKAPQLQSPARYFLPFMAPLPLVLVAAFDAGARLRSRWATRGLAVACLAQGALSLGLNARLVTPVLLGMTREYIPVMTQAAREVNQRAAPGEALAVFVDIGVVACALRPSVRLIDGGGLASPALQGIAREEILRRTRPRFVLESLGTDERIVEQALARSGLESTLIWSQTFPAHGIQHAGQLYVARLYAVKVRP